MIVVIGVELIDTPADLGTDVDGLHGVDRSRSGDQGDDIALLYRDKLVTKLLGFLSTVKPPNASRNNSQDGNGDEDFPHGSTSSWLRLSLGIPLRERKSFEPERSFPLTFFFVIPSSTRFPNYSVVYYTTFNFNR